MKKTLSFTAILIILQFFVGCAVNKPDIPAPHYTIKPVDKVGFIIKSNDTMVHTHFSSFSEFDKQYPKLVTKELVSEMIHSQIKAELVDLSNERIENIKYLIIPKDNKWIVSSRNLYEKYLSMGLKAILVIEERPVYVYMPPTNFVVPSSGFASTSLFGIHRYIGITGYTYSLILLDPIGKREITKIAKYEILRDPMLNSYEEKSGLSNIQDFEKLSEKELVIIKDNILRLTRENITRINKYLTN